MYCVAHINIKIMFGNRRLAIYQDFQVPPKFLITSCEVLHPLAVLPEPLDLGSKKLWCCVLSESGAWTLTLTTSDSFGFVKHTLTWLWFLHYALCVTVSTTSVLECVCGFLFCSSNSAGQPLIGDMNLWSFSHLLSLSLSTIIIQAPKQTLCNCLHGNRFAHRLSSSSFIM